MAKNDQGYSKSRGRSSSSRSGGRSRRSVSKSTYLSETKKDEVADLYIRTIEKGILDVLQQGENEDLAVKIREEAQKDIDGKTKSEIVDMYQIAQEEQDTFPGYMAWSDLRHLKSAEMLLDALYSATKAKERADLDDGDLLDDPVNLIVDGDGWGEVNQAKPQVHKHVNIAVDDSGSTHTAQTGYCHNALTTVASNLMDVLHTAGKTYDYVTYDAFTFNRITEQHTGSRGREQRAEKAYAQLQGIYTEDPLKRDASKTFLAPLLESFYENEVRRNKIGEPRIDLILTDGEFESIRDMNKAVEWQRKRGPNVTTYVINVWPENTDEDLIPLPHEFRVVPVHCITLNQQFLDAVEQAEADPNINIVARSEQAITTETILDENHPRVGRAKGYIFDSSQSRVWEVGDVYRDSFSGAKVVNNEILRTLLNQIIIQEVSNMQDQA